MDLHQLGEERSIAMHSAIAERLRVDPNVLETARSRVRSWLATGAVHQEYARAWLAVLDEPLHRIVAVMVDPSERSRELRQVSPFAGALDARERWRIRREVARALR